MIGFFLWCDISRKYSLLLNNIVVVATTLIFYFTKSFGMLIAGRVVQGFVSGW